MLDALRWALRTSVDRLVARLTSHRVAAQLAKSQQYSFTEDWVSGQVEQWRLHFAKFAGRPNIRLLEIGSYEGRSAIWFLENIATHPTSELVCVDSFHDPRCEVRFDHNMKLCRAKGRVDKRRGHSETILPQLERASFDLIYVDGSHQASAVLLDAMLSWELLKPGGILTLDDYEWEPQLTPERRPQLAIDLFLRSYAGRYDLLYQGYQVAISKRQDA
jgi:predicted O-methyltransferase YrrM